MGRIYGEKRNVEESSIKRFWNGRASKYNENSPFVSIKLGDKRPERAEEWDKYEKENIIPLLNISAKNNVLDIGCGIGRLSDVLIPNCKYYLGIDYAESLIDIARKRVVFDDKKYAFHALSFQDINRENILNLEPEVVYNFHTIILDGILPYINDTDIKKSFENIIDLASDECMIYIETAIGEKERLTLDGFWSEDLESKYSAIYRTNEEYLELFSGVFAKGFSTFKYEEIAIPTFNDSETKRVYYLLKR